MNARVPYRLASILVLLCFAADASAQTCLLRNRFRLANSYGSAASEVQVDTGWLTTRPLVTNRTNDNPGSTCFSRATCAVTSDYGLLRVSGTGSASNCTSSGTFLYFDGGPQANFSDTVTVTSPTLSAGTPVQLRLVLAFDGHARLQDSNPSILYRGFCSAGATSLQFDGTTGWTTGTVQTSVGGSFLLQGQIQVALYAYGLLGLGIPPASASYDVDLTVRVGLEPITADVSLTTCSGVRYPRMIASVEDVGGGCGAGSPIQSANPPRLGQTQTYVVASAPALQALYLAVGAGPAVAFPLGACTITEDLGTLVLVHVGATDASGNGTVGVSIPPAPSLAGDRFTTQALVLSSGGPFLGIAWLSNGLTSTVGL